MRLALRLAPPMLTLMLAACGDPATDASGATPGEAQALNEAAAMLDANSVSADAVVNNSTEQDGE